MPRYVLRVVRVSHSILKKVYHLEKILVVCKDALRTDNLKNLVLKILLLDI